MFVSFGQAFCIYCSNYGISQKQDSFVGSVISRIGSGNIWLPIDCLRMAGVIPMVDNYRNGLRNFIQRVWLIIN